MNRHSPEYLGIYRQSEVLYQTRDYQIGYCFSYLIAIFVFLACWTGTFIVHANRRNYTGEVADCYHL